MTSRRRFLAGAAGVSALLAGCASGDGTTGSTTRRGDTGSGAGTAVEAGPLPAPDARIGYPHLRATGNRVVAGAGALDRADPVDVSVGGVPTWLAAVPLSGGSAWAVVTRSGRLSVVRLRDGEATVSERGDWPAERPPVLRRQGDGVAAVRPPDAASPLTPPLVVPAVDDGGEDGTGTTAGPARLAFVAGNGDLAVAGPAGFERVGADLLPDARLCLLDAERAVALGGPTTSYAHGALGDETEASEVVVLDLREPAVERRIAVPEPRVVEGIAPIVADLGGDRAIVVTESDAGNGARLVAYAPDGRVLASGDPVGTGYRWRHQVAVAPFGPDGERELAVVKTPHIGGTVEFYRRRGGDLRIAATVSGASSHAYRSRNLDGGLAADADGDGRTELVVPDDDRRRLRGVERRDGGATAEWSVPVGGNLSTNVVGVGHGHRDGGATGGDGTRGLAVGVGSAADGGTLRVWTP